MKKTAKILLITGIVVLALSIIYIGAVTIYTLYLDSQNAVAFIGGIAEGSRTHNGLKCHFCPSLRYLHRKIRPVCPCASALI